MSSYVVTGGTGFLGRAVVRRLVERDADAVVHVLVRPTSEHRLSGVAESSGHRVRPLIGDLERPGLGIDESALSALTAVDHVIHLGAIYDLTAGEEQESTNVQGTAAVAELARSLGATLHHVSSIAVAGDFRGTFTEDDFDRGQGFPTPYHRTKFEAEKVVRETPGLTWRVYRPAAVVGDSRTGEIDKIDGPYYLFRLISLLAELPSLLPMTVPALGATNIVPVDYVADALVALVHTPGLDGRAFHLVNPRPQPMREVYSALADAAGAPRAVGSIPGAVVTPLLRSTNKHVAAARDSVFENYDIPPVMAEHLTLPTRFDSTRTREALSTNMIEVPPLRDYAPALWSYWRAHLDPYRARRDDPAGPLVGRHVVITGGSSGIGKASAFAAARKGARVILIARDGDKLTTVVDEIRATGAEAHGYVCDITDDASVAETVPAILADHGHVDMLVNNAGRSIRRSLTLSTDRLHDFERTMAVNYFGALRLILALLPHMRERKFGHVVNISSASVQSHPPRFAAYVASKSALDAFTSVAASETLADGISFTTIHMPLVDTPMIAPTGNKNVNKVETPEKAAAMVMRALIEKPKRIDVPTGTAAEWGNLLMPRSKDRVLASYYKAYPDSAAAKGSTDTSSWSSGPRAPKKAGREFRLPRAIRRAGRWVPGASW
ncbi:SDR family oxidoreductase [Rhodococcus sp. MEB064]|uniref:SDR family oxidoreductase n=1 Tax=Rhodococcus sp. MEB064 TaxID=1587522 RepID=UPI0005AD1975|nr:SDR family oxidoreductase [Rhodococcus sp. MEB064]KIQ19503.1 short-chain dehydrogenase [Rhodococcus sp. MEB064]